jgi:hypothetical protein
MSKKLVLFYAAALCLLLNFIIPPFQNPDEPQHFRDILAFDLGETRGQEIEERLIELMDRYDWWKRAGMGRPAELPRRFADIPFLDLAGSVVAAGQPVLYHAAAGRLLRLVPSGDILTLYYVCRLFSAVLFCGSLLLLAAAFSRVGRSVNGTAGLGFFFILFLPQFSVLSVSVNPEAAATFWGALFFYAAAAWLSGTASRPVLALLPVAALAGFLTDRSSFYLVPAALLLPFFSGKRERPARSPARIGLFMILALIAVSWAAWFFPGTVFSGLSSVQNFLFRAPIVPAEAVARAGAAGPDLIRFMDSVWLKFGWMAFPAGGAVYYAWRAAAVLAIVGLFVLAARRLVRRTAASPGNTPPAWSGRLIAFSAAAIALQLAAILRTSLALQVPPQGRYLFPVVFPLALLFVLGLESLGDLFGRRTGRAVIAAWLVFEAVFFVFALWGLIAPAFHLTLRAPHPGI